MSEMTVTDARNRPSNAVDTARVSHEPVYLLRRGRRVAALIDAEDLATLIEAAEDLDDGGSRPPSNYWRSLRARRDKEALRKQRRESCPHRRLPDHL